jgi:hypothetical protein
MAFLEHAPTQTLFQFCSVEGFRGIVASKSLWYTDLQSSNDPRELKLGFEHFMDAVNFVRKHDYAGADGRFLQVIPYQLIKEHERQQAFCACFSLLGDALPMWREYGDDYRGMAIGFRPTAIISMPGRVQRARYLNPDTADDFRRLVRDIAANFDPDHSPNDLSYWVNAASSVLAALTALKHHTWEYEKEIRLVFAQGRDADPSIPISNYTDGKPIFFEKPLSRIRGNECVEYKVFRFGRLKHGAFDFSRAIARVVIGPRCELSIDDVKSEMQKNGFVGFDTIRSECYIR